VIGVPRALARPATIPRARAAETERKAISCQLDGTESAQTLAGTIRLKLLKIGAVIVRNTLRIRLLLSSAYPYQGLFAQVTHALRL
jgi:hypothetical protein